MSPHPGFQQSPDESHILQEAAFNLLLLAIPCGCFYYWGDCLSSPSLEEGTVRVENLNRNPWPRTPSKATEYRIFLAPTVVARGRFELPSTGFFPISNGPKPVTGRACAPLLVRYTTGLQSTLAID